MTNTPPPMSPEDAADRSTDSDTSPDAAAGAADATEAPVFDEVTAEHPEVQDAAPELIEPESTTAADRATPLVEPVGTRAQDAATDTAEAAGYDEHIDEPAPAAAEPVPVASPVPAARPVQTVYVAAPVRPRNKGNRGFGLLFGLLALIAFAVVFLVIMAIVLNGLFPGDVVDRLVRFVSSTAFIVPVAVFFVAFAVLVLLTNRAGWWAYVLGSFLVAVVVYFGSIGVVLLTGNVFQMTEAAATATFWDLAANPSIIIAAILAREVTIWFGAGIAARGRRVKERNLEARAAYERELDNQPLGFS